MESPKTENTGCRMGHLNGIKLHYLLFFGGQSAMLPFLSVMARQLGISASALGIVYAVLPFVALLSVPLICNLADRKNSLKTFLMCAIVAAGVSYGSIGFLIPIKNISLQALLSCNITTNDFKIERSTLNGTCQSNKTEELMLCSMHTPSCSKVINPSEGLSYAKGTCLGDDECVTINTTISDWFGSSKNETDFYLSIYAGSIVIEKVVSGGDLINFDPKCEEQAKYRCPVTCSNVPKCVTVDDKTLEQNVYRSRQFWVMLTLIVLSWVFASTVVSLADSICYQILEYEEGEYGKQRLFGTLGWGGIGTIIGAIYTFYTRADGNVDYTIGYILMAAMFSVDIFLLYFLKLRPAKHFTADQNGVSTNIGLIKTIMYLFKKAATSVFLVEVFLVGFLTGLQWSFGFWYFQDVGANHTVLGLTIAVQCVCGELPFFFYSDVIIKRLGHFNCVALAFLAYGVRYVLYGFIRDPWLLLAVEVFHGPAYSLFYSTMTSYAKKVAPPGAEASVQGIMAGTFENFGSAIAGLVGGFALERFGGRATFLVFGCLSTIFGAIYVVLHKLYLKQKPGFSDDTKKTVVSKF